MGFLRRLLSGGGGGANDAGDGAPARPTDAGADAETDAEESARELELLRAEQDRLDDLVRRQQRYADRSWTPPPQGGPRRSDDGEDDRTS